MSTDSDSPLRWHYGPTPTDPEPGNMHCYECGGDVLVFDGVRGCSKCGREELPDA